MVLVTTSPFLKSAALMGTTIVLAMIANYILGSGLWAESLWLHTSPSAFVKWISPGVGERHPIEQLMIDAENRLQALLSTRTYTKSSTIAAYCKRRNMAPPRGFDTWLKFANSSQAMMIEEFWDPIYEDLAPFRNLSASSLRWLTDTLEEEDANEIDIFWITDGQPSTQCDDDICQVFLGMLRAVADVAQGTLPDMRIPYNVFPSPRVWVPWERMQAGISSEYTEGRSTEHGGIQWKRDDHMPNTVRATCPPGSTARTADGSQTRIATDLNTGFVRDYEHSKSPCHQPELLQLHGTFFAPWCDLVTVNPVPIFSAQKVGGGSGNAELRVPSTIYWEEPWVYHSASTTDDDWSVKSDVVFWRGANGGGVINESNWRGFHRHRFVAMMDADNIFEIEESGESSMSWAMPESTLQFLRKHGDRHVLSEFVRKHLDVGFYRYGCESGYIFDDAHNPDSCMVQLEATFRLLDWVRPSRVQRQHKYLIDLDGTGYSARFRSYMLSSSVPIKATIFSEWHDSRLIPWKHFVPMQNNFGDIWGILDYFLPGCLLGPGHDTSSSTGKKDCAGHDRAAERIGVDGSQWAQQTLRKDDMILYLFRLLLEFARLLQGDQDWETDLCGDKGSG